MDKKIITKLTRNFEDCSFKKDGIEFWFARGLQKLLGYCEWRNFLTAISKAKESCTNSESNIKDHFVDINKTINMPKGAIKKIQLF